MGANRVANIDQQNMLLNAGQDDSAYDTFFANRPLGDGVGDVEDGVGEAGGGQQNPIVEQSAAQDDDADYETAQDHQSDAGGDAVGGGGGGLIEEEQSQAPLIERRPSVNYSTESNMVGPWLPRSRNPARAGQARSNNVMGKYWRTFGERASAIGGGLGGFFGALFGRGMKRANAIAGARNRRAAERGAEPIGLRSALRTRLANEGAARADETGPFPQEPGVAYDEDAVQQTRGEYAKARKAFSDDAESKYGLSTEMKNAHAKYDLATGSRSQPLKADLDAHSADKFHAITRANHKWGEAAALEDVHPHQPKPRLRNDAGAEKRVRFMDGANAQAAAAPRNVDAFDPKPRPTGVRFHPVPMMTANREGMTKRQRQVTEARERAARITDEQALAQEQTLWPIRNSLSRLDPDLLDVTGLRAGAQAHQMMQANPDPSGPEAERMRELYATGELAGDISSQRLQDNNARATRSMEGFPTKSLNGFQQGDVVRELLRTKDPRWSKLDPRKPLKDQLKHVPKRYFKNRYWNAYDSRFAALQAQSDSVAGENASEIAAGGGGAVGNGAGMGAGLIQEEPELVQQQPLPHEAWHVLQQQ